MITLPSHVANFSDDVSGHETVGAAVVGPAVVVGCIVVGCSVGAAVLDGAAVVDGDADVEGMDVKAAGAPVVTGAAVVGVAVVGNGVGFSVGPAVVGKGDGALDGGVGDDVVMNSHKSRDVYGNVAANPRTVALGT